MTLDEAKRLGKVLMTADGECPVCVTKICKKASTAFPEFLFTWDEEAWEVHVTKIGPR